MSDPHKIEPVEPSVSFVTHAGDRSGRTADHSAWLQDLEDRKARGAEHEAKRRQLTEQASKPIDVVEALAEEITKLSDAADAFERDFGRPDEPLLAAKQLVADLEAKLATARQELAAIESLGDSVSRLRTSVQSAESVLLGLHSAASNEIGQSLPLEILPRSQALSWRGSEAVKENPTSFSS